MATEKPDLARAGTMEVTAQVGQQFLDKNLTEWKKPYLMDHFDEDDEKEEENNKADGHDKAETNNVDGAKGDTKLAKHTTMVGTAKEAEKILEKVGKPDDDALTRGQQKKIDDIQAEEPPAKKPKMARDGTMAATAKEGKDLLAGEKLGDTRGETKSRRGRKSGVSKGSTMNKAIEEAKELYGDIDVTGGRSLRKRPEPPKPSPKRAGTMQRTAKEGKEFVKGGRGRGRGRGRPRKSAQKEEDEEEEEAEKEEEAKEDKTDDEKAAESKDEEEKDAEDEKGEDAKDDEAEASSE